MNVSPAWAWAAGLFEGEGSITVTYRQCSLQMATTDADVMERFVEVVGYGNIHPQEKRPGQTKRQYRWHVSRATEVVRILNTFMPYLGERRKAKAVEAIDFLCPKEGNPPFSAEALTALSA